MKRPIIISYGELKYSMGYLEITKYVIEIEVVNGKASECHQMRSTFHYAQARGNMCLWLFNRLEVMVRLFEFDGTLLWNYPGTPYEKTFDSDGVNTEFVWYSFSSM